MKDSKSLQSIDRPVASLEDEYPEGYVDDWHSHERNQLIYASKGVLSITTSTGSYIIPPQRALWIPAYIKHTVVCRSDVSLKTLYIDNLSIRNFPGECKVIGVSDLLRALILQAINIPRLYEIDSRNGHIMQLILDEIEAMPIAPLLIPMPSEKRLERICLVFIKDPSENKNLDVLAKEAGMSRRTFTRLFRQETKMSFSSWRQQVRLLEAISRISAGASITTVSLDVGYNSPSAFTAMFQKTFGVPPSKYF
ncbi:MAG: helix-turn-helix transcriptional regulator [Paraglaciecola sp.]|uniref:AraC family transcriptional regulator n=1 Tax=Paraglaciecola sp. TaxID=1920173 RepID=UPI0032971318